MFITKKTILRAEEDFFYQCYNALVNADSPAKKEGVYRAATLYRDALLMDYPKHKDTINECWNNFKPVFIERLMEVGVEVE